MPQLSLYIDEKALDVLRNDAKNAHTSMSKYVTQLIRNKPNGTWPAGYWESIYGVLDDDSFVIPDELDSTLDGPLPDFDN